MVFKGLVLFKGMVNDCSMKVGLCFSVTEASVRVQNATDCQWSVHAVMMVYANRGRSQRRDSYQTRAHHYDGGPRSSAVS